MDTKLDRAPAVFFGHGSPMNALGGPYAPTWARIGAALEARRPKAVLMVSAHWQGFGAATTAQPLPPTLHDFGNFPAELHAMQYPAPGAPELAARVSTLLAPTPAPAVSDWGLDHGTWSVLIHVFPEANIPIVQLRLDHRLTPAQHYALGQRLAPLREEGVMIAASGDVVHNLRVIKWDGGPAFDWAASFNARVKSQIAAGDHAAVIAEGGAQDARLSIPTDEHWTPLLYVLGASLPGERPAFFNDVIDMGSISILSVGYGLPDGAV